MALTDGRKSSKKRESFVGIPKRVVASERYTGLSPHAVKLLIDICYQYNGRNNGPLTAAWAVLRQRGWKSTATLYKAKTELIAAGFICVTRMGRKVRSYPTLVAVTWNGIDEPSKGVRYDEGILPSNVPLSYWCKARDQWSSPVNLRVVSR